MSKVKLKERNKFKTYGRCEINRKQVAEQDVYATPQKINSKDYVNEIFAGLMWLG